MGVLKPKLKTKRDYISVPAGPLRNKMENFYGTYDHHFRWANETIKLGSKALD